MPTVTRTIRSRKNGRATDLRKLSLDEIYELAERLGGRPVPGVRMTEAEFEAWCDEDVRAEWVDGEVILMPPVNLEHDDLNTWLITLLRTFIDQHDLGTLHENLLIRFAQQRRRRVPDLCFVARDRAHLLQPTYLDGAPDLMLEIISPDSQSRDRREKFEEYERAGVREYWIIDPLSKTAEAYRLEGKKFRLIQEQDGVLMSSVLRNFWLKTEWLWRKPLPKVPSVLKQMRGKAPRRSGE